LLDKGLENGYWVRPTVFTDCTDDMRIVQEEIFGPVMSILYYDTTEEAVEHANKADLGLAAGVFGKDLNMAHKVVRTTPGRHYVGQYLGGKPSRDECRWLEAERCRCREWQTGHRSMGMEQVDSG
jgi:acyl-CoA reductase-like NAD-dependent aldehyde dehydrogenase